ncbi:MAG: DNA adenine methylase [Bacillota bacterium]
MDIIARLKEAQIENKPAVELIKRFNRPEVLIYADPPYLLTTRKMKKQYENEMTDQDHCQLLETLIDHKGTVLLSGYDSELYRDYLKGWQEYTKETTAEKGLAITENLWIKTTANMQMGLWG